MKTVRKHIIESRKDVSDIYFIVPPVVCKDGFTMSVQHSGFHYCLPRVNFAERKGLEFEAYEVGFPSTEEDLLMFFAENVDNPTGTVYPYVPQQLVEQVAEMHGGLV